MRYANEVFFPYSEGEDPFIQEVKGRAARLHESHTYGHLMFHPMPTRAESRGFYEGPFADIVPVPDLNAAFAAPVVDVCRGVLNYVADFGGLPDKPRVHDLGCGVGAGVWGFQQLGLRSSGNEENLRSWAKAGNSKCNAQLSTKSLADTLEGKEAAIDFFFSSHYLNLIADPLGTMSAMAEHLSDDGLAYINVPNGWSDRIAKLGRRSGDDYNFPIHLHFFTPASLRWMLAEAGLEVVNMESRPLNELPSRGPAAASDAEAGTALHLGELHVLAAKPTNRRTRRRSDLDAAIADARTRFTKATARRSRG